MTDPCTALLARKLVAAAAADQDCAAHGVAQPMPRPCAVLLVTAPAAAGAHAGLRAMLQMWMLPLKLEPLPLLSAAC
jgi:hypothetical protein